MAGRRPRPARPHQVRHLPARGSQATTSIPIELNVDLFPRSDAPLVLDNPYDLYSSKEVGEPPLVLAATAFFAVKHAILAARRDRGHDDWFELDAPATVQRIRDACLVTEDDLTLAPRPAG